MMAKPKRKVVTSGMGKKISGKHKGDTPLKPKRYKFKRFAERLEDVDIDVFHSLTPIKFEPSGGSSFFHESLVQWRELNAAADFIAIYEELLPLVQTLPQLLLHKEVIVGRLLSHVHLSAMLSLEPILSLVAILSRDLREEFIPFISRVIDTCCKLLETGGDRETQILEQVFTSISYVIKYMLKFLTKDLKFVLRITRCLRHYPKIYVQEFAAEAVSFLLRKAPIKELVKGVRKLIAEVEMSPSTQRIASCSSLLFFTLRSASGLHSRAQLLLRLLLDESILRSVKIQGGRVPLNVVAETLHKLCEDVDRDNLELAWNCLIEEISSHLVEDKSPFPAEVEIFNASAETKIAEVEGSMKRATSIKKKDCNVLRFAQLLFLLNGMLEYRNGIRVTDFKPLFELAESILQNGFLSLDQKEVQNTCREPLPVMDLVDDPGSMLISEIYRFLLGIIRSHSQVSGASSGPAAISTVAPSWTAAFDCNRPKSVLGFLRGLLEQGFQIVQLFTLHIVRALSQLLDTYFVEVLPLYVDLFEKLNVTAKQLRHLLKNPQDIEKLLDFITQLLECSIQKVELGWTRVDEGTSALEVLALDPAVVSMALQCLPYVTVYEEDKSTLAWEFAVSTEQFLREVLGDVESLDEALAHVKKLREFLLGTALRSHLKILLHSSNKLLVRQTSVVLDFVKSHAGSVHILAAAADFLDACIKTPDSKCYPQELQSKASISMFHIFSKNLLDPSKALRLATLRVLNAFEPLSAKTLESHDEVKRESIAETSPEQHGNTYCQIMEHLLSIESAPFVLENCRQSCILISRLKVDACKGKYPSPYLIPLTCGMLGLFYNRFTLLWDAAMDCIMGLMEEHDSVVWEVFLNHLVILHEHIVSQESSTHRNCQEIVTSKDIWTRLDAHVKDVDDRTDDKTVVSLLLKILQKIPKFAEARSRQLVPLFLSFLDNAGLGEQRGLNKNHLAVGKSISSLLQEWLNLLKEMKNARALFRGPILKEVLQNRFILSLNPGIQEAAFDCLLNWRDPFLMPYAEHLKRIFSIKTLREELTVWNVGMEGHQVQDQHREELIPILIKIIYPKVVKMPSKSSGKSAGDWRKIVVLPFLSNLEAKELALLFCLLLRPLQSAFTQDGNSDVDHAALSWETAICEGVTADFINRVDRDSAAALPHKRKLGFLNLVKDILEIFGDHHLGPYLHVLLAFVFRFLEASPSTADVGRTSRDNGLANSSSLVDTEKVKVDDIITDNPASAGVECQAKGQQLVNFIFSEGTMREDDDSTVMFVTGQEATAPTEVKIGAGPITETICRNGEDTEDQMIDMDSDDEHSPNISSGNRALRNLCLKVICQLLTKFENLNLTQVYWEIFFKANQSSISRIRDESISSSTPGALFSCFLAMSKSMELAPLLTWNEALIPAILSILSVKQAPSAIISAILTFVENILNLKGIKSGDGENSSIVEALLVPNIRVLLTGLQVRISAGGQKHSGKHANFAVKREVQIIFRLSDYINDCSEASQLVDALLMLLRTRKHAEQDSFTEILDIVRAFARKLNLALIDKCLHLLGTFLMSITSQNVRLTICKLLLEFAQVQPSFKSVADLLADLNAISKTTVEEYDYDLRLDAYARVSPSFLSEVTCQGTFLLLSHFVYDMESQDMSLRHSASNCLQIFVRFAASLSKESDIPAQELASGDQLGRSRPTGGLESCYQLYGSSRGNESFNLELCLSKLTDRKLLIKSFLLPAVRSGLGAELLVTRREWVTLLREMVFHFAVVSPFDELQSLIANDVEVDFFNNIVHLQVHRRIKAMSRFRTLCLAGQFSEGVLTRIFIPLFMASLFEAKVDKEGNLVEAAVQSLGCVAAQLPWTPYFGLIMRSFRLIAHHMEYQKALVRLVCLILDHFHFYEECSIDSEMVQIANDHGDSEQLTSIGNTFNSSMQRVPADVYAQLHKQVFPEISKFLISKEHFLNASVALAVVKVLKLMPREIVDIELPRILQTMTNLLKNRSQAVRDETRSSLVSVTETLGAQYLSYILKILKGSLTKGYELHVLGYTLNSILLKIVPNLKVGEIDYCLGQILEILERDIFGEVSEEKDVKALAVKMKEIKRIQSFESFKLVAQVISFRLHALTLLNPVEKNLVNSLLPKVRSKIELVLKHLAVGILCNPSLSREELFVFVHGLIEGSVKVDGSAGSCSWDKQSNNLMNDSSPEKMFELEKDIESTGFTINASLPNVYLITEFALNLLHSNLKKGKVSGDDGHILSMLAPFVVLLEKCLYSSHDGVVCGSIKCLCFLLKLPLPSRSTLGTKPITLLFSIAHRSGKSETPLLKACLNLLIVLLRYCEKTEFSKAHLRSLLKFPVFVDLETDPSPIALSLLKAIVARKLVIPELYDMMTIIERLMVTSHMLSIRQQCSQILLQFLLDYPLGPKRLQQHMDFFINNLSYEHATGREAALEMIHTVIVKFPDTFLEEHLENIFFPVVTRLVNDPDNHIRALVGTVLKLLIGRASPQSLQHIFEVCFSWLDEENRALWRLGAQLMGFLIETTSSKFGGHLDRAVEVSIHVIEHLCLFEDNKKAEPGDKASSGSWEEVYFALTMVEKLFQQFPDVSFKPSMENLWDLICSLLLHQHMWVRKACLRIIRLHFTKCGTPDKMHLGMEPSLLQKTALMHPSRIILLIASISQQLDTGFFDEEMSEMIVQNMVFLICFLHLMPSVLTMGNMDPHSQQLHGSIDQKSKKRITEAFVLLGADRYGDGSSFMMSSPPRNSGSERELTAVVGHGEINFMNVCDKLTNLFISLVFQRFEKIGLRLHALQAKTVFKWFISISTQLGGEAIQPYLHFMLRTLFKVTEGSIGKVVPEDVKSAGDEVLTHLRVIVGVEKFLQVYNIVRQTVKERREKRKSSQKIAALVDPELHAKRKMHLIAKRRAQKKRKLGDKRK